MQVTIAAMDRGEAGATAGTCCPVTSDIHAALGIIRAAGREAVELALVNRRGSCRDLRRARAIRNHHRACDQQPKGFIHGTGPVPGLGPSLYGPFYLFRRQNKIPDREHWRTRRSVADDVGLSGVHPGMEHRQVFD